VRSRSEGEGFRWVEAPVLLRCVCVGGTEPSLVGGRVEWNFVGTTQEFGSIFGSQVLSNKFADSSRWDPFHQ
jgi:hypothetical protein